MPAERLPIAACPKCGQFVDGATDISLRDGVPSPGDMAVCIFCGAVNRFDLTLNLRSATSEEINSLNPELKAQLLVALLFVTTRLAKEARAEMQKPDEG